MRPIKLCVILVFTPFLVLVGLQPSVAQGFSEGISSRSYGRFADWPTTTVLTKELYESDLIKRVYPDAMARSHKNLKGMNWRVGFGWANPSDALNNYTFPGQATSTNDVSVENMNWIRKEFLVRRYLSGSSVDGMTSACDGSSFTYKVSVSGAAPGTWITSERRRFYVRYASAAGSRTRFTHLTYYSKPDTATTETLVTQAIPNAALLFPSIVQDWVGADSADPNNNLHNWIVLAGEQNGLTSAENVVIPLMISVPPGMVVGMGTQQSGGDEFFYLDFADPGAGVPLTVGLSIPLGAPAISGPADTWVSRMGGAAVVGPNLDLVNKMVCNHPTDMSESFDDHGGGSTVDIQNTVTITKMDAACRSFTYTPIPPLASLAVVQQMQAVSLSPATVTSPFITKYGVAYQYVPDVATAQYTIPAAPRYDLHAVAAKNRTANQQMVDEMLDHSVWQQLSHGSTAALMTNNRGETFSLALASAPVRGRYLDFMRQTIQQTLVPGLQKGIGGGAGEIPLADIQDVMPLRRLVEGAPPSTPKLTGFSNLPVATTCSASEYMRFLVWFDDGSSQLPWDIDAFAGMALEFLFEYVRWTGDTSVLTDLHATAQEIYRPVEAFHDWATMCGSARVAGTFGSSMDMFSAQYAAHHAMAGIMSAVGDGVTAARARYVEAKTQLPIVLRFSIRGAIDDDYFTLADTTQVISGVGENEVSGPLAAGSSGGGWVFTTREWSDWTISGERVHPIVYEVYERLAPSDSVSSYDSLLRTLYADPRSAANVQDGMLITTFPDSKIYAFARHGLYDESGKPIRTDIDVASTFFGASGIEQGFRPAHAYAKLTGDWYTGQPSGLYSGLPTTAADSSVVSARVPYPLYAALLEEESTFGTSAPIRIGGPGMTGLLSVHVDAAANQLVATYNGTGLGGELFAQCDDFTSGPGFDPDWKTIQWTISPGATTVNLPLSGTGATALDPPAAAPRTNELSDGSFEQLGVGGANLEYGWAGETRAVIEPPIGWRPEETEALHLTDAGIWAFQVAYVDTVSSLSNGYVPYKLSFKYKMGVSQSRLQVFVETFENALCLGSNCEASLLASSYTAVPNLHASTSTDPSSCIGGFVVEADSLWRDYEIRGVWGDTTAANLGPIKVKFQLVNESCNGATPEAWIDTVSLEFMKDEASIGFAGFRLPNGEKGFAQGEQIPINLYYDDRLPGAGALTDGTGTIPSGELKVQFSWFSNADSSWTAIPDSQMVRDAMGNGAFEAEAFRWIPPETFPYTGITRLKATYWEDDGAGGARVAGSVESADFSILAPLIFTNKSAASGIDLIGKTPYSSIALDLNGDPYEDLAISFRGQSQPVALYKGKAPGGNDIGTFVKEPFPFAGSSGPSNARGLSAADVNADGRVDLFVGTMGTDLVNPTAESFLFFNDTVDTTVSFSDQSALIRPAGSTTDHAWAGAWGDYNADGWLDLYIVRANDHNGTPADALPSPGGISGKGLPDILLAAVVDPATKDLTSYRDVSLWSKIPTTNMETVAASWGDIDRDGDLDLFVSWLGPLDLTASPGWSPLFLNNGDDTFTDVAGMTIGPRFPRLGSVSAVNFADIGADGLLDIAVSRQAVDPSGPQSNTFVCYNDPSEPGNLTIEPHNGLLGFTPSNGISVQDIDADGHLDVFSSPAVDGVPPTVLMYVEDSQGGRYFDNGQRLSLPTKKANGLTVVDFNNDGDLDLYLGIAPVDASAPKEFLFASDVSTRTSQNSIRVNVVGRKGYAVLDGVGALVDVSYTPIGGTQTHQVRHIDASGGEGSQTPSTMTFGIGSATSASVTVIWPDATQITSSGVAAGTTYTANYPVDGIATIADSTVTASHYPTEGYTSWTFRWETTNPSIYDEVMINDSYGGRSPCAHYGPNFILNASNPAVRTWSRKTASGSYKHTLVWSGPYCVAPCTYRYRVRSWSEVTPGTQVLRSSTEKNLMISICGSINMQ